MHLGDAEWGLSLCAHSQKNHSDRSTYDMCLGMSSSFLKRPDHTSTFLSKFVGLLSFLKASLPARDFVKSNELSFKKEKDLLVQREKD